MVFARPENHLSCNREYWNVTVRVARSCVSFSYIFRKFYHGESRWCFEIGAMIDQSQELHVLAYCLGSARGHSSWRQLRTISTGSSCPRYLVWQSKRSPCKSARARRQPFACTCTVLIWQDAPILKRSDQLGCGRPLCAWSFRLFARARELSRVLLLRFSFKLRLFARATRLSGRFRLFFPTISRITTWNANYRKN